jgi:N utilization substance protein B
MPSRHLSRRRALQMLYECDLRRLGPEDAMRDYYGTLYSEENPERPGPDGFVEQLVLGTHSILDSIDQLLGRYSEHWKVERMPMVDRNILRMAVYEMMHTPTPPAVVIDEAIELARKFSGDESARFINGVLDALCKGEDVLNRPARGAL